MGGVPTASKAPKEASKEPGRTRAVHGHDATLVGGRRGSAEGGTRDVCGPEEHARRARLTVVSDEQLERAASIFRAAGDISRLKLLHRLSDGEWCVTELADAAGVGLSTVSQQLRLLRAERIVARRRAGKHIFYSLADSHVSDLIHSAIEHAAEPHTHEKHEHDDRHDDTDAT
jgi:DNA-binding transcriptional ArsR family regulator